jgi:hypothetical protein
MKLALQRFLAKMPGLRLRIPHRDGVDHSLSFMFKGSHLFYFAAVAIEAHGFYALAAGGLFILFGLNLILKFEE